MDLSKETNYYSTQLNGIKWMTLMFMEGEPMAKRATAV